MGVAVHFRDRELGSFQSSYWAISEAMLGTHSESSTSRDALTKSDNWAYNRGFQNGNPVKKGRLPCEPRRASAP